MMGPRLYSGKIYLTDLVKVEVIRGIQNSHEKLAVTNFAVKEGLIKEVFVKQKSEKQLLEKLSVTLGAGEAPRSRDRCKLWQAHRYIFLLKHRNYDILHQ